MEKFVMAIFDDSVSFLNQHLYYKNIVDTPNCFLKHLRLY